MFAFDGTFKTRPIVSLGGASKKEERSALLHRAQIERKNREEKKKRIQSAITIQAFIRGSKVRHRQYDRQRLIFDETVHSLQKKKTASPDLHLLTVLIRRLVFFYSNSKDNQRLIWVCQLLLKHHAALRPDQMDEPRYRTWIFQIKNLLVLCCRSLEQSMLDSSPIAVQLRMLEVFTTPDSHTNKKDAIRMTMFLIRNGYFRYLRALINLRVPSSLESSPTAPTPLAGALVDLVLRPVNLLCQGAQEYSYDRLEVLAALTNDMLCPEMSEQFINFVLPYLSMPKTMLPFARLVETIFLMHKKPKGGGVSLQELKPSPWLLYAILVLAEGHLGSLTTEGLLCYLHILQFLLPHLPLPATDPTDSDDSDSEMEVSYVQDERLNPIREECLKILDSKEHVRSLESLVTININKTQTFRRGDVHDLVLALCSVCHHLMTESRMQVHKTRLLYTLALNSVFIHELWMHILIETITTGTGKEIPILQMIHQGQNLTISEADRIIPMLSLFCALFSHSLFSIGDKEFYGEDRDNTIMPFSLQEIIPMTSALCDTVIGVTEIIYPDSSHAVLRDHYVSAMKSVGVRSVLVKAEEFYPQRKWISVLRDVTHLVKQLHSRDARRSFCPENHWLSSKVHIQPNQIRIDGFLDEEGVVEGVIQVGMSAMTTRFMSILRHIPFVVPFKDRVMLLQRIISKDRQDTQGDLHNFMMGPSIDINIQRKYLYQDAFDQLNEEQAPNLKQRVRVRLINDQGLEEAGIDGGGLFREFLNELLKAGFDPNIGYFKATNERLLYPNPQAKLCAPNYLQHFRFLGRMLGKAIYENMLAELPFASFFLCKLLGRHGTDVDIHNLESLDPEVYKVNIRLTLMQRHGYISRWCRELWRGLLELTSKSSYIPTCCKGPLVNLLFLKTYEGNVEELALNFTIVNNDFGETQVVELLPNGKDIPVTNSNRILYIHLVADYRLNRQIHAHCQAFRAGLAGVIDLDWLRMFDHNEIQVLISGAPVPVDLEDLKRNTNYSGGYNEEHPCIQSFWRAVEDFNDTQKRQLLKFVTSCSRPPLLGFKELYPAFCVHSAGQEDRLPTASTCMNLLKLPEFPDDETMKERLLYAVESGAGFELS